MRKTAVKQLAQKKEESNELQPIYLFLHSQLNVELVYAILQGVSIMNKSTQADLDAFGDVTCA